MTRWPTPKPDAADGPLFAAHHDGETYEPAKDKVRLNKQTARVYEALKYGEWKTLRQLSDETGAPEASVSARLRDLRKDKFGAHVIERARVDGGLHRYRLADG